MMPLLVPEIGESPVRHGEEGAEEEGEGLGLQYSCGWIGGGVGFPVKHFLHKFHAMQCCGRNVSKFHGSCVKLLPKRATQDISALRATYRKLRPAIVAHSPTITIIFLIFLIVVLHMIFLIFLIVVLHMIFLMWPL